ncbi:ribosome biogenesis factor YjgA [Glaciecola sp. 2405UD65-10]|uniref:ribosome biogenesis factor YjgA n=1 Tax=Glaciecola sp. 2405UD65-10 TaxID=3397244 RepID=UPI003B5C436F
MSNNSPEQNNSPSENDELEFTSKTQLKQAADQLKKLGLELVDLTPGEREKIPLDDELLDTIELCTRINRKKDGFRRQLQLIGKKLRSRDTDPIERALAQLKSSHTASNKHFHILERLRDTILNKGEEGVNKALEEFPQLERQRLRQLVRNAQKQEKENKPPVAARELFQYLREEIPMPSH